MFDFTFENGGTGGIYTSSNSFSRFSDYQLSTDGTMGRHNKGLGVRGTQFFDDPDYFGNDFPGFAYNYGVTNANI